jgi:hypothetical protein
MKIREPLADAIEKFVPVTVTGSRTVFDAGTFGVTVVIWGAAAMTTTVPCAGLLLLLESVTVKVIVLVLGVLNE